MPRKCGKERDEMLCPAFRGCTEYEIRCESHIPESSSVVIRYTNNRLCEKQKRLFCEGEYKRCEHYITLKHMKWDD